MDEEFDDDYDGDEAEEGPAPVPLDRREAARVRRDLDDLAAFRHTFEADGFKGVSMFCEDCLTDHFYGWEMLEHNLRALLSEGETPMHEPAYDPRPEEYIDWDYAQGYLDGMADAGGPALPVLVTPVQGCPFCGEELPGGGETAIFCPTCGSHLGPARIARALLDRGWTAEDVAELLAGARLPPLRGLPDL